MSLEALPFVDVVVVVAAAAAAAAGCALSSTASLCSRIRSRPSSASAVAA